MSQKRNRSRRISEEEMDSSNLEDSINECVRYILCRQGSKIPIKRAEILKHLHSKLETSSNQVNSIISEANKLLKRVYGIKLVQVDSKSGIQYIVVLHDNCESELSTAVDPLQRQILMASLMHIFMSGGSVQEDDLWKFLEEAGLLEENDFSTRKTLVATFTKQLYLLHSKVGEGELARQIFEWGQRATEELPKMFALKKMAEAFEKPTEYWFEQNKEALQEVENLAE